MENSNISFILFRHYSDELGEVRYCLASCVWILLRHHCYNKFIAVTEYKVRLSNILNTEELELLDKLYRENDINGIKHIIFGDIDCIELRLSGEAFAISTNGSVLSAYYDSERRFEVSERNVDNAQKLCNGPLDKIRMKYELVGKSSKVHDYNCGYICTDVNNLRNLDLGRCIGLKLSYCSLEEAKFNSICIEASTIHDTYGLRIGNLVQSRIDHISEGDIDIGKALLLSIDSITMCKMVFGHACHLKIRVIFESQITFNNVYKLGIPKNIAGSKLEFNCDIDECTFNFESEITKNVKIVAYDTSFIFRKSIKIDILNKFLNKFNIQHDSDIKIIVNSDVYKRYRSELESNHEIDVIDGGSLGYTDL